MTVRYNTNLVQSGLVSAWDPANTKSLPVENLFIFSEDFSNVYWNKTASTITANAAVAPDGTLTADKLIGDNGITTRQSVFALDVPVTANVTYRFSVYLKAAERRYASIWFDRATVAEGSFYGDNHVIDLQTGTFAVGSPNSTIYIQSVGNGWHRLTIVATPTAAVQSFSIALNSPNNSTPPGVFTGDGVSGIFIWGAQLSTVDHSQNYVKAETIPVTASSTINDLLPNRNNIPLTGFPSYSTDGGGSLLFGGLTTQKCILTTTAGLPSGDLTMMAWVKPDATQPLPETYTGILAYGTRANTTPSTAVGLGLNTTNSTFSVSMAFWNNDYVPNSASVRAISNQWNLVGLIARSAPLTNNVTLFSFNSSGYNSITGSSTASSRGLLIANGNLAYGSLDAGNTRLIKGNIGLAMIYGRRLSEDEIKQNIQATRTRYGL